MTFDESSPLSFVLLVLGGLVSGFIDSIAGGGGLVTLPMFTLLFGPGSDAVGTNKMGGLTGALVALWVYSRKGHMDLQRSLAFALWVGLGSFLGSKVNPWVPASWFTGFLALSCPLILWVVWNKDLWVGQELKAHSHPIRRQLSLFEDGRIGLSGLLCGFYDGLWGPGGGTFMFLSLFFFARLPLFTAIAASKLANSGSALVALVSFAMGGHVHPAPGIAVAFGIAAGALSGAHFASTRATHRATRMIRPVLGVVVGLLVLKLLTSDV